MSMGLNNYHQIEEYQFVVRCSSGVKVMKFNIKLGCAPIEVYSEPHGYFFHYSPDGKYLAILVGDSNFVPPHIQLRVEGSCQGVPQSSIGHNSSLHQLCPRWIDIMDTSTWKVLCSIKAIENVEDNFYYSPKGNYLVTYQSFQNSIRANKTNEDDYNLKIWYIKTGEVILNFKSASKQGWPLFQWTDDESVAIFYQNGQLHLYNWADFSKKFESSISPEKHKSNIIENNQPNNIENDKNSNLNDKNSNLNDKNSNDNNNNGDRDNIFENKALCVCGIPLFKQSLSIKGRSITTWTLKSNHLAIYMPERPGVPGTVEIYTLNGVNYLERNKILKSLEPCARKTFYQADEVSILSHSRGKAFLAFATTHTDESGLAYYGNTFLHYISTDGKSDTNIVLDKQGPIHDAQWNLRGDEFAVVYGFMPARTTFFSSRCKALGHLGSDSRNKLIWSPQGRVLAIGGFGQLTGQFDIWDTAKFVKLGSGEAYCSSTHEWSADGKYLLTAVTWSRMKVDNEYKIFDLAGRCVWQYSDSEVHKVSWQPLIGISSPYHNFSEDIVIPEPVKFYSTKKSSTVDSASASNKTNPNGSSKVKGGAYKHPHWRESNSKPISVTKDQAQRIVNPLNSSNTNNNNATNNNNTNTTNNNNKIVAPKRVLVGGNFKNSSKQPEKVPIDPRIEKIRELQRNLNMIKQLKENQATGKTLNADQLQKIKLEAEFLKQLETYRSELNTKS